MSIFLGVDGGGTKTAYLLSVEDKLFKEKTKTIHLNQISRDDFMDTISTAVKKLCNNANIKVEDIDFSFLAIPGYGQFPENEEFMEKFFDKFLGKEKYKMGNDCVNGWAGSLNLKEGINLVLGTGSIAFGVDKNGQSARSGGWGPFLGDESSGYYIGKKLLALFTKMSDGRIEKSYIYDLIREELNIREDIDIIDKSLKMKREEIADLGKLLGKALDRGDRYAEEILEDISYEAALTIDSLINRLDFTRPVKVSYSGGVYKLGKILLDKIKTKVKNDIDLIKPTASPIEGSLMLAKRYYEKGDLI